MDHVLRQPRRRQLGERRGHVEQADDIQAGERQQEDPALGDRQTFLRDKDARQWAAWGFDYLKYDWNPIEVPETQQMPDAFKASGRDVIYSLSNHAPFAGAADWARLANAWRTTGDIRDNWKSMSDIGFPQDKWAHFAGPGHWNDPDMLVVGMVGWGPKLHPTDLTPDEQYTHITLWCLLSAPLLIGCDMTQMDDFTLSLLTNDEVLAVDQDALGQEATRISTAAETQVWAKPLADGTWAVGLFNLSGKEADVTLNLADLKLTGSAKTPRPLAAKRPRHGGRAVHGEGRIAWSIDAQDHKPGAAHEVSALLKDALFDTSPGFGDYSGANRLSGCKQGTGENHHASLSLDADVYRHGHGFGFGSCRAGAKGRGDSDRLDSAGRR